MSTVEICRVCETKDDLQYNIFDAENVDLLIMLRLITTVQFDKNDSLPKHLCINCAGRVPHAYAFKQQCETTDRKLRERLRLENENIDIKLEDDDTMEYTFNSEFHEEYLEELGLESEETEDIEDYEPCKIFIAAYGNNDQNFENDLATGDPLEKVNTPINSDEETNESKQNNMETEIQKVSEIIPKAKHNRRSKVKSSAKEYSCGICMGTFPSRRELLAHLKTNHRKERFKCSICSRGFSQKRSFIDHQSKHTNEPRSYPCKLCDRKFANAANLRRHVQSIHDKRTKYSCDICGKGFARLDVFRIHQSVHITEKLFECDQCDHKFKSQYYLTTHKKLHDRCSKKNAENKNSNKSREKNLTCPHCDYHTSYRTSLQTHIRTHTGQKPFECGTCSKRFHSYNSYWLHLRIHTGERPFGCDICGEHFRQWPHLKYHQRKHSTRPDELKPFLCDFCGKPFSLRATWKIHLRSHTGERPFECSVCSTKFADKGALRKHKLKHEKVDHV